MSICVVVFTIWMFYSNLYAMFSYQNQNITQIKTSIDLDKLGSIYIEDMDTMPYLSFMYKGKEMTTYDKDLCQETNGNCIELLNKYLKV